MEESQILAKIKDIKIKMKPLGLRTVDDQLPQISWILLLKILDDFDLRQEDEPNFKPIIPKPFRWRDWTADKKLTDQPLINYVTTELFPKLRDFPVEEGLEVRQIITSIFRHVNNRIPNGMILREIIDEINDDELSFTDINNVKTFANVYEQLIIEMRNAAKNRAVFYTPKAIVQFIVNYINPDFHKKEKVFDPACGMGGFLIESFKKMKEFEKGSEDIVTLRENTLYGVEKEGEYFLCAVINMLLHDISKPKIFLGNSLLKDTKTITPKDQYHVIMTNPTYGGSEDKSIKDSLPNNMKGASTELHFLYYVLESLRDGGRAAVIVPNGVLNDIEKPASLIKEQLMSTCNLHTIVRLPESIFAPYNNTRTNILFFEKVGITKEIWYYDMPIRAGLKHYNKTNPPTLDDFTPVIEWMKNKELTNEFAWKIIPSELKDYNLNLDNPNKKDETRDVSPHELIQEIISNEKISLTLLKDVEDFINDEIPK
jgi:type I restriction enzyme M protein